MDDYIRLLEHHDWWYDYSEDHSVWQRGNESWKEIQRLRAQVDPKGVVWNQYAPKEWRAAQ